MPYKHINISNSYLLQYHNHSLVSFHRFLAKKTNMFTSSGFRELLLGVTILPEALNSLSEAALLAQIQRYFIAN